MEGVRATGQPKPAHKSEPSAPQAGANLPPRPQTLSPKQGAEALVESGVNRHAQRVDVLFLKAIWGGIFLSYGGFLEAVIGGSPSANTNNPGLLRLVEGLVFPVGLTMIVLSGVELLTSDMMFIFLAALKGRIPWWGVPYNYFVVFWGNLVGSLLFMEFGVNLAGLVTPPISTFIQNATTSRAVTASFHQLLLRGIGCNIMVCMSVYLAAQGSELVSKVFGVFIPLTTFVVCQYEHVVADMFTIPMGIILNTPDVSVGLYIWKPLIGALVGNLIGAFLLSISLYWFYLHDTSASVVPSHNEKGNGTTNGDAENGHIDPKKRQHKKVGPFGRGSFGYPYKLQHSFHQAGYDRHHF